MKQIKFVSKLLSPVMLSLALQTLNIQVAQTQQVQRKFLLNTNCVTTVGENNRWGKEDTEVAIGREVYTSLIFLYPGNGFSCRLSSPSSQSRFQTLRIGFGLKDSSNISEGLVYIYLDGNRVVNRTVTPGKAETALLDVKNIRSVAIEFSCSSRQCPVSFPDSLRVFQATLESPLRSPGSRR